MTDTRDAVRPHGRPDPEHAGEAEPPPTREVLAELRERAAGLIAELTRLSSQVTHLQDKINSRRRARPRNADRPADGKEHVPST
ncbi:hypothetical protein [Catellatospora bangladeshensis]|uniref:Uncharacterized protein n=1 Tax=Catellatospora bangladeshensis TaxID=310355 RepID=A0A8J3JV71_9ACTN|nr:hypothetical protein [Catellatospora bangladeshensis]GIF84319.1 hypothetical protein Cba03nite_56680 [Catellatospora bangladeshensis]